MKKDMEIQVCDKCMRACCWLGEFMCDESQYAGTLIKTVKELKKLKLENKNYWKNARVE